MPILADIYSNYQLTAHAASKQIPMMWAFIIGTALLFFMIFSGLLFMKQSDTFTLFMGIVILTPILLGVLFTVIFNVSDTQAKVATLGKQVIQQSFTKTSFQIDHWQTIEYHGQTTYDINNYPHPIKRNQVKIIKQTNPTQSYAVVKTVELKSLTNRQQKILKNALTASKNKNNPFYSYGDNNDIQPQYSPQDYIKDHMSLTIYQ